MKLSFRNRFLIPIIIAVTVIVSILLGFLGKTLYETEIAGAEELSINLAKENALKLKLIFEKDLMLTKTVALAAENFNKYNNVEAMSHLKDMMLNVMESNPKYFSIWLYFDKQAVEKDWLHEYGRNRHYYYREGNKVLFKSDEKETAGYILDGRYLSTKRANTDFLWDPYFDEIGQMQMTTIGSIVRMNDKHSGQIGIDMALTDLDFINDIKPFKNSYAYLIGSNGTYIWHPDSTMQSKFINQTDSVLDRKHNLTERILKGEAFSFTDYKNGEELYFCFEPLSVGNSTTHWSLAIITPKDVITAKAEKTLNWVLFFGLLGILIISAIIVALTSSVTKVIVKLKNDIEELAKGNFRQEIAIHRIDEIGDIVKSLNSMRLKIREVLSSISNGSAQVETMSKTFSQSSMHISDGAANTV